MIAARSIRAFLGGMVALALAGALPVTPALAGPHIDLGSLPATDADLNLAVPSSPAFTILGISPESVSRPSTPREFAADVLNGLDAHGHFQTGIALDTAPYLLLKGERLTISQYRENPDGFSWIRFLSRTQLSAATAKGTDKDDPAVRAALGLKVVPFDRRDPRLDRNLDDCFSAIDLPPPPAATASFTERQEYLAKLQKDGQKALEDAFKACRTRHEKQFWNASAWEIGVAPSWIQPGGTNDSTKWAGAAFWTSFAYGFEEFDALKDTSQMILGLRYRLDEKTRDKTTKDVFDQDTLVIGGRLRIGQPRFNVSLEGSYVSTRPEGKPNDDGYRFSVGADFNLARLNLPISTGDNTWLEVAIGGTGGHGDDNHLFISSSLKWGSDTVDLTRLAQTGLKGLLSGAGG